MKKLYQIVFLHIFILQKGFCDLKEIFFFLIGSLKYIMCKTFVLKRQIGRFSFGVAVALACRSSISLVHVYGYTFMDDPPREDNSNLYSLHKSILILHGEWKPEQ